MKKVLLLILFLTTSLSAQTPKIKYWLDPEGKEIKEKVIDIISEQYPDNAMAYRKTIDSGIVYQFNAPKYSTYKVDYKFVKAEIEKITNQKYSNSAIFMIKFDYLDDSCDGLFSNTIDNEKINSIKYYDSPIKLKLEQKSDLIYLSFFEDKIILKNKPRTKNDYFFSDKNHFFRNNLFLHPTICGSFGLIKPNGETLIRNGAYRLDLMFEHLTPEIWNLFFQQ